MKKRKYIVTVEYLEQVKTKGPDGTDQVKGQYKTKDIEVEANTSREAMEKIATNKGYKITGIRQK